MPFANHRGGVAVLLEKAWNSKAIFGNESLPVSIENAALELGSPVVATGDDTVSSGGAD